MEQSSLLSIALYANNAFYVNFNQPSCPATVVQCMSLQIGTERVLSAFKDYEL